MPFKKLNSKQYKDLDAIVNGDIPDDPWPLYWEGFIEPINKDKTEWKLTKEGGRQYTYHKESLLLWA